MRGGRMPCPSQAPGTKSILNAACGILRQFPYALLSERITVHVLCAMSYSTRQKILARL